MKKNVTLSLDYEAYLAAKEKLPNVSEYVSECLRTFNNDKMETDNLDEELKDIDKILTDGHVRKSVILAGIKQRSENNALKAKELAENEQFNRWVCPICNKQNFMENISCNGCNLKTRNSPKTTIISTKVI